MFRMMSVLFLVFGFHAASAETSQNLTDAELYSIEEILDRFEFDNPVNEYEAAELEDAAEMRPRGPRRGPGRRGPGRRGPRFGVWKCFAENVRGHLFSGRDRNRRWAMREAMIRCERVSRRCFPVSCERRRRPF